MSVMAETSQSAMGPHFAVAAVGLALKAWTSVTREALVVKMQGGDGGDGAGEGDGGGGVGGGGVGGGGVGGGGAGRAGRVFGGDGAGGRPRRPGRKAARVSGQLSPVDDRARFVEEVLSFMDSVGGTVSRRAVMASGSMMPAGRL